MSGSSLNSAVEACLVRVREVRKMAEPIIDQVRSDKRSRDFIIQVHDFLNAFGEITTALDALPVKDGAISVDAAPADRQRAEKMLPALISEIEVLAGYQLEIIDSLKKSLLNQGASMKSVRDARKMFENFVKRPPQDAKFFDKKG